MTSIYWDLANCQEAVDLGDALMSDVANICDTSFLMGGMRSPGSTEEECAVDPVFRRQLQVVNGSRV